MSYTIEFSLRAQKALNNIQEKATERIFRKFQEVKKNPFRYLEHYEGDDHYKLRIGSFRALIDVDFKRRILIVRIINKRSKIYNR